MKTVAFLMLVSAPGVTLTPDQVAALQAHILMLEQQRDEARAEAIGRFMELKDCQGKKQF